MRSETNNPKKLRADMELARKMMEQHPKGSYEYRRAQEVFNVRKAQLYALNTKP